MKDLIGQVRNRTAFGRLNSTECERVIQVMAELGYGDGVGNVVDEVSARLEALVTETESLIGAKGEK
jgi:hypothetical protein